MTVKELKETLDAGSKPLVVDVRSHGEFAAGHVPGAVNIPMEEAEARLADLPEDQTIVLVCQSGNRADMTCELIRHERPLAEVLEGGTDAWMAAGKPTVCSRRTRWSLDRQVRLGAGVLVLAGTVLSLFVAAGWIYLAMFVGAGLTFAGLTNFCGMATLLAQMPWNKPKAAPNLRQGAQTG